jgi:hypothetical protein
MHAFDFPATVTNLIAGMINSSSNSLHAAQLVVNKLSTLAIEYYHHKAHTNAHWK